jgi:RNA polymerase sigma-70 factor (ECF subfamily)
MNHLTDEQLIARVLAGERSALAPLVERHHQPLFGYLYRLTHGQRHLAEDLVQDTFIRVLQQSSFQTGRPFKPWLYAIATNLAYDHFRRAATRPSMSLADPMYAELSDAKPGPEERVQATSDNQAVVAAIRQLASEYQTALLLRFYCGLCLQEIAEVLGVPIGTVKSRLSVGTRRLRDLLVGLREGIET